MSPGRRRFLRLTWGSTSGADGPSSTTGPRSARFWGFVSAPSLMRTSSRWLAEYVCRKERQPERVREELLRHCRAEGIEPPTPDRVGRIIGSGLRQAEQTSMSRISGRVLPVIVSRLAALVEAAGEDGDDVEDEGQVDPSEGGDGTGVDVFAAIRRDPGNVSLKTITTEVFKLEAIRAVGLPEGLLSLI